MITKLIIIELLKLRAKKLFKKITKDTEFKKPQLWDELELISNFLREEEKYER